MPFRAGGKERRAMLAIPGAKVPLEPGELCARFAMPFRAGGRERRAMLAIPGVKAPLEPGDTRISYPR